MSDTTMALVPCEDCGAVATQAISFAICPDEMHVLVLCDECGDKRMSKINVYAGKTFAQARGEE
jgi:uncharacterized Zn finger protein